MPPKTMMSVDLATGQLDTNFGFFVISNLLNARWIGIFGIKNKPCFV